MSLKIKPAPEPPPMTRLSVKIPAPTATMLAAYVKAYEQSYNKPTDGGFIVNEILLTFFNSDREFQDLLKKNPDLLTTVAEKPAQQNKPTTPEGL